MSSAQETAREVRAILTRRHELSDDEAPLSVDIMITGSDVDKFAATAKGLLKMDVPVTRVSLA